MEKQNGKLKLEYISKQKDKRTLLQNIILQTIISSGVISLAFIAPKVIKAMQKAGISLHIRQKEIIGLSRKRLVKRGLIQFDSGKLQITEKGKLHLITNMYQQGLKEKKQKWDGKWRVLVFDIPEKRRFVRNQIRKTLISIGFMRLQDSVWIYPYDCEDLITLLKADMKISKDVLYMIVNVLEYDKPIKDYFGLSEYK